MLSNGNNAVTRFPPLKALASRANRANNCCEHAATEFRPLCRGGQGAQVVIRFQMARLCPASKAVLYVSEAGTPGPDTAQHGQDVPGVHGVKAQ